MTTQNNPTKNLTDEDIKQIALAMDEYIVKMGEQYRPNGIQLSSIVLGRLMVFTKHVGCYDTFCELMDSVLKMSEPKELLDKTEDIKGE